MKGFVYILKSLKDNNQYIGSTIDVQKRFKEHNAGFVKSTETRRPFIMKRILQYESIEKAAEMEKKFKKSHDVLNREMKLRGVVQ